MADIEVVIRISEKTINEIKNNAMFDVCISSDIRWDVTSAIENSIPLPKGHGRLIDTNYLLNLLKCEKYESCTWKNCSDCNQQKCIRKHNILEAPTIIEADREV